MQLKLDFSSIPNSDVGHKLLDNLLSFPSLNVLHFPSWRGKYDIKDFKFDCFIANSKALNPVTKEFHSKAKIYFAKKRVKIQWRKFMDSKEAKTFNQLICEIDTHLKYSPDVDSEAKRLIRFYGFGIHEFEVNFCTELMDGNLKSIRNHIREKRKFFPTELLQYIAVVLVEGLDYLKTKFNIMHRDIKPDNILYNKTSKTIKLADFGISRTLSNSKATTVIATMIYLPPERIGIKKPYGIESDIWGLGMVLAEMVCGKFPLIENEDDESLKAVTFKLAEIKNGLKIENLVRNSVFGENVLENLEDPEIEFINVCLQWYDSETNGPRPSNYAELKKLDFYKDFEESLFDLAPFLQ